MIAPADKLASRLLARHGLAVIHDLQCAAGSAYRAGRIALAASLLEIAEAATEEWERDHPVPNTD